MELEFMSEPWVAALADRLKASDAYKKAGKGWRTKLALALLADADKGTEAAAVVIDLDGGELKSATRIAGSGPYEGDFVIRGVAENWKKLLNKEIFPAPAVMSGQLQLVQGSPMGLMTHMGATQALLDEAGAVPTKYPA